MSLSQPDREWVKAMAMQSACEIVKEVLKEHIKSCPHGQRLSGGKNLLIGICIGAGLFGGGGGVGFAIAKFLGGL